MNFKLREKELLVTNVLNAITINHKYLIAAPIHIDEVLNEEKEVDMNNLKTLIDEQIEALKTLVATIKK